MEALPSGTVTFLFTDIEGSTKLAQEHPNEMPMLMARHHEILHHSIQAQNGYVFQIIGDAFCAAFHSASDALNAALQAQQVLQNESWNPAPVKVRMGIHTGAAQLTDEKLYSGYTTLALTQRIMSAGHGGQVLICGATRELVRDTLPEMTELKDLGEKRLKDLLRPAHLYQLDKEGLATAFPPLKTLDSFPNNLPVHLTSFIGREDQIAEVKQDLNEHRLVTLTGSGGTGKTRLSLQVAADLLDQFSHGVWFVELAPLADPDLIPQAILSAMGVKDQSGKEPLELLKTYLQEKKSLIVLDNCEHVISASAQVVDALLRAAPGIKVMASSREALGVRGEVSYPVPSLTLPNIKHLPTIEGLSQYEAVRLFIDRALLVSPRFVVDKDNAPYLAQICHRLDGIPLAIELAAARIKVLTVEQISNRLDDRFRLLTGGARTALPRQQTLHALIDWSYDLLSDNERLLLGRLSVFAGGWTLEAAEEVCEGDGIDSYDVLNLLTQLVNKSLVAVIEGYTKGESRYRMLETIRQYAREKLAETGGGESIRDKHLAYFIKLAEQAEPELYRSNQGLWLKRLDAELDNFRAALERALNKDIEAGLRIISTPSRFWYGKYVGEAAAWLDQLFTGADSIAPEIKAKALWVRSEFGLYTSNIDTAIAWAQESLSLYRNLEDQNGIAKGLSLLGWLTGWANDSHGVIYLQESLALFRELQDPLGVASIMYRIAFWEAAGENNYAQAMIKLKESESLYREIGDLDGIAGVLSFSAMIAVWQEDYVLARALLKESQALQEQLGSLNPLDIEIAGRIHFWLGEYAEAQAYFEKSLSANQQMGDIYSTSSSLTYLGYVFLRQNEFSEARSYFKKSLQTVKEKGLAKGGMVRYTLEGVASLAVCQNEFARAICLLAWADTYSETIKNLHPPAEQRDVEKDLETIHAQMDDATFAKLWENGSMLSLEQAIALALEE
jgi:predicted ATPase/class 3 adenylate cyclase